LPKIHGSFVGASLGKIAGGDGSGTSVGVGLGTANIPSAVASSVADGELRLGVTT
jgi:hypothetical protein